MNFKKLIVSIIVSMLLTNHAYGENISGENKDTLVIGKVSAELKAEDRAAMKRLVEDVAKDMAVEGIKKTQVYLAKDISEMIAAIKAGKVDWVSDSLFTSLLLAENTRSDAFLSKSRDVKRYHSIFFVRKKSESTSMANIQKKIMLFENRASTYRYFVPFYELTSHGYIPIIYGETGDESGKKKNIFYKFEKDINRLVRKVMASDLIIGVLSDKEYESLPDSTREKFKIIHQTVGYPQTLDLIRSELDIDLKIKLKKLLLDSSKQVQQQDELKAGIPRFEKFVAEGRDGYVFLRSIIKHDRVPTNIKKPKKLKDLKEIEDQKIYEREMAKP